MLWSAPKTDWEIKPYVNGIFQGDWFNVADYIRVATNIRFLHYYGQIIYAVTFSITAMPDVTLNSFVRPAEINLLEDNIYTLTQNLYEPPTYTGKATWVGNGATPDAADLNRMEQACAGIYADMIATADYESFIPLGSDALITADGKNYGVLYFPMEDYMYVYEAVTVSLDYESITATATEFLDYGRA